MKAGPYASGVEISLTTPEAAFGVVGFGVDRSVNGKETDNAFVRLSPRKARRFAIALLTAADTVEKGERA